MTENEIKIILSGIFDYWTTLTPAEVKSLLKILMVRGVMPNCAACHKPILDIKDFSWDHLIARSKGGPNLIGNVAPMHTQCNVDKGDEIDESYFCHVSPDVLQDFLNKKSKKKHTVSKNENNFKKKKKRNHIRMSGWVDNSGYNNYSR